MRRSPVSSSRRALSLAETLVAAALLLVVTGIALQFFWPVLTHFGWLDSKQDRLQAEVLFRNYLDTRLKDAWVTGATPTQVEFYQPERAETSFGRLTVVDPSGLAHFDKSRHYRLSLVRRGRDAYWTESVENSSHSLWNLGPDGACQLAMADRDTLQFTFSGTDRSLHGTPAPWRSTLLCLHPGIEFRP